MDIDTALKKLQDRSTSTDTPPLSNKLEEAVLGLPRVSAKTAAAPAKPKSVVKTNDWDLPAPVVTPAPITTPAPVAVELVNEHQPAAKDTRLALRDTETGTFVSTDEARKHPETVATDYIATNAKPAKKAAAKKTTKLSPKVQKAVVTASADKSGKAAQKVVKVIAKAIAGKAAEKGAKAVAKKSVAKAAKKATK